MVLHVGDISYANGRPEVWGAFMRAIEPAAQRVPYMVAVGNHEYDYHHEYDYDGREGGDPSGAAEPYSPDWGNFGNDSGGECGVPTSKLFSMPDASGSSFGYWPGAEGACALNGTARNPTLGPGAAAALRALAARQCSRQDQAQQLAAESGGRQAQPQPQPTEQQAEEGAGADNRHRPRSNPPFWYSHSVASVHFVVLSSEHDLSPGSDQYQWLEGNLRRVDRCATPWVVAALHRPLYVVHPHKINRQVSEHLRDRIEPLLNDYEVDLVLSGHVHAYSRTCNALDGRCVDSDEGGMVHITVGTGGHRLTHMKHEQPDWLEQAEAGRYGYGRIEVDGQDGLLFEFVGSEDGRVYDSVRLRNSRTSRRGCYDDAASEGALSRGPRLSQGAAAARAVA